MPLGLLLIYYINKRCVFSMQLQLTVIAQHQQLKYKLFKE